MHSQQVLRHLSRATHLPHCNGQLDGLAAGKHLLMEKPLANSEAECLDLIGAAQAANVTLMVAYCMRFHPIVVAMERLLKAQTYGDLFQLSIGTGPRGHPACS